MRAWLWMLWSGQASAARVPVPLPTLCAESALVVVAEVTGQEGRWSEQGLIETWSDLAIIKVLRGVTPVDPLSVVRAGGAVGGLRLEMSESAPLRSDARYLLLLSPRADGAWTVHGGAAGAILLGDESAARARLGSCLAP